jgi:hypothetical protein
LSCFAKIKLAPVLLKKIVLNVGLLAAKEIKYTQNVEKHILEVIFSGKW